MAGSISEQMARVHRAKNLSQVELGAENLADVREFFRTHLCATNRECGNALGLSEYAVGRHVRTIRAEWSNG